MFLAARWSRRLSSSAIIRAGSSFLEAERPRLKTEANCLLMRLPKMSSWYGALLAASRAWQAMKRDLGFLRLVSDALSRS